MNCPVCNVELRMAERQGVEIDYCPQCRGIWLDRGELDKIIERSESFEPQGDKGDSNHDDERRERNREDHYPEEDRSKYKTRRGFLGDILGGLGGD